MFEDANVLLCSMCARASAQRESVGGSDPSRRGQSHARVGRGGVGGGALFGQFFVTTWAFLAPKARFLANVDHFIAF